MTEIVRPKRRLLDLDEEARSANYREVRRIVGTGGIYPLNAPGMPPPGPDFVREAAGLSQGGGRGEAEVAFAMEVGADYEVLYDLHRRVLREPGFTISIPVRGGRYEPVQCVPGHIWGQHMERWSCLGQDPFITVPPVDGPHPADVFVLGKMPGLTEVRDGRLLTGPSGELLLTKLRELHVTGMADWYVTNLLKFLPTEKVDRLKAAWVHDCLPLLAQELRIVRPRYMLILGADALRALFPKETLSSTEGRVLTYRFPVHVSEQDEPCFHETLCLAVTHPAAVLRASTIDAGRAFERGLERWRLLLGGARFDLEEKGLDHRICESYEEAVAWTEEAAEHLDALPKRLRILACDAEWEGQHPINKGAYLVCVQFSWDEKKAICFHLHDVEGRCVFRDKDGKPALKRLAQLLTRFANNYRIAGHFFVSDLEHLVHNGFDLRAGYAVPLYDAEDGTPAWKRCMRGEGGLDTGFMDHAVEETAALGLEAVACRYTTAPRYDLVIEAAIVELCKQRKIKRKALDGYGKIDRDKLLSYSNYDADVGRRIAIALLSYLDSDYFENNCWESFWESMIIQPIILAMHRNGARASRPRIDELTVKFMDARERKEKEVRELFAWPDFNIRSVQHVKEVLFGEHLNGKRDETGRLCRIRPAGARTLRIMPLLDTSKPPVRWEKIVAQGREREANPSTNKSVMAILAQDNEEVADQINAIRDYRLLDQALKNFLRPPTADEEGNWQYEEDPEGLAANGLLVYDSGIAHCIDDDGRVRTHMYPTAETKRWKHARPNLANIAKSRDSDYARLLGEGNYKHKMRSVLCAEPGNVLGEFDYIGAELLAMAVLSGDPNMIDHVYRAQRFPDRGFDDKGKPCNCGPGGTALKKCKPHRYPHPEYYDIHARIAINFFRLNCHPSKAGLDDIGKPHLRIIAKSCIFGLCYGRQARALAMAAREQKINVSEEDAQGLIDTIFKMYPLLARFLQRSALRSTTERTLCSCFGAWRRFPVAGDERQAGDFERQAMNWYIQTAIAEALDRGLAYLYDALVRAGLDGVIRPLLAIHDAGLFEMPPEYVGYFKELVRWAMCEMVVIHPADVDGTPVVGRGPYRLGVEFGFFRHWGEPMTVADCEELGLSTEFAGA